MQLLAKFCQLLLDPLFLGVPQYNELPFPGSTAYVRKSKEVKRLGFAQPSAPAVLLRKSSKFDQSGFIGMQFKIKLSKTLNKHFLELLGILSVLEAHHKVIAKPHDDHVAGCTRLPPVVRPDVEDVVKINVGKQRTDTAPLRYAFFANNPRAFFQNSRIQPFLDVPQDPFVYDSMLDEFYQPFMVDGIKGNHDTLPTSTVILKVLK